MSQDEVRAFNALAKHPRLGDLVTLTRELVQAAAAARKPDIAEREKVAARAEELKLASADATTEFGDALGVLERGPADAAERALACALYAHVLAESPPKERDEEDKVAGDALWLATHTPFDATRLFDRAFGEASGDLWGAVADRVRRVDQGKLATLGRGEALLGCAALAMSTSEAAQKHASQLASDVGDPVLLRILSGRPRTGSLRMTGELTSPPRNPFATAALAFTGILFVAHGARLLARLALAYRCPAEVLLTGDSVRIHARTLLLGRTLQDREIVLSRASLVRATREVRYPRLALYAGLVALAFGSYVGVLTFVDGVRAASPSLLLLGTLVVAVGIGLDFLFASLVPGARGHCRVVFVPRRGKTVCVGEVDARDADTAMTRLATEPG
jgi:hypothetical protein